MQLEVLRYNGRSDSTGGLMFADGAFACYTCEDQHQAVKVDGETRIPAGTYQIKLRNVGGMTQRYARKFPTMHAGMLHLQDVPGFEWVYIHIGNDDDDTLGCILVGERPTDADRSEAGVLRSTDAYRRLYTMILEAINGGERVFITLIDKREGV